MLAGDPLCSDSGGLAANSGPKAILFDVNETLLDLGPVSETVGNALGGGPELASL